MENKVKCEYCGALFNYNNHNNCPCCGAALADNPEVREIIERNRKIEQEKIDLKKRELNLKQQELNQERMNKMLDSVNEFRHHSDRVKREKAKQGRRMIGRYFGLLLIVGILFALAVVYGVYECGLKDYDWKSYIEEIKSEKGESEAASTEYAEIGKAVKKDYCEFKINRIRKYKKVSGEQIKNNSFIIAVDIWVKNTGKLNRSLDDFKVFYYDSFNNKCYCRMHEPNSVERASRLNAIYLDSGISVSGSLFFGIPSGISEAYVEFGSTVVKIENLSKYAK